MEEYSRKTVCPEDGLALKPILRNSQWGERESEREREDWQESSEEGEGGRLRGPPASERLIGRKAFATRILTHNTHSEKERGARKACSQANRANNR
ncbi:hypothetical protein EYF80_050184 [Liparis tanakae]|uniref:Uncharacterized protein n=1 Tax=Liparis tanakae TaxID=230148 RepID=A0A4Z2FFX0_9TELE|nr:hypothetical protein EYF80_050184 [Liparis tanakae]